MTVITMSRDELTRLRVLIDVADGRLSVADATGLIGVGRRQVYRLLQAFRADGPDGLISRKRGGPSNRALGAVFRETVLAIVLEHYADFGPTLAAEKLSELHGLDLGVETLRQWMIGAGIWVRRIDRLKRVHQPRIRRDCLGELVQIDGSEHWWFEDRGPQCTLLVYVDDATSRLMHLKFVETESTFDYFQATRESAIIRVDVTRQWDPLRCHDIQSKPVSLHLGAQPPSVPPILARVGVEVVPVVESVTPSFDTLTSPVMRVGDRLIERLEQARGVACRKINSH
jgi:hypothetical protein